MRIADNVALLPVSGQSTVNFVLTWDENHLVLIDAGFFGQTEAIIKAISDEGFNVDNLTHLIITHQHGDHIGCVADLKNIVPTINVMAHEDEAPYMDGRKLPVKLAEWLEKYDALTEEQRADIDSWRENYKNNPLPITEMLSGGTVLPMCGGIEVVHTPGHTPGHIVLFLEESRIMVCGDAANIKDGELVGANPVHTYDIEQAAVSLEKIKSYNPSGVVAYHGGYLKLEG